MYQILDECGFDWLCPSTLNNPNPSLDKCVYYSIANWNTTRWIVLSSIIFATPSYWSVVYYTFNPIVDEWNDRRVIYYRRLATVNASVILASAVSVNFWRNAKKGWRRNLDLIVAKISMTTAIYNSVITVRYKPYMYMSIIVYYGLYNLYTTSYIKMQQNDINWVKYHFMFHICIFFGCLFASDGIRIRIQENI